MKNVFSMGTLDAGNVVSQKPRRGSLLYTVRTFLVGTVAAAGLMATAAPSVTVGTVKTGEPWSTITVDYTLNGVDADLDYKVAFDVTANGVTKGVTNAMAKLADGTASKVIDTAALFGAASADPKANVRVSLIAVKSLGGVQLWENGPYWAECNVGASKPEEYGYYFWWGDTVGYTREGGTYDSSDPCYTDVTWVSSTGTRRSSSPFDYSSCPTCDKSTSTLQSRGYIDSTGNLVVKYDAATAHLGAPWRIPTDAEFLALINNCTTTWTTRNGVYGWLVTGKGAYASKSIFLPAAGGGLDSRLYGPGSSGGYWSSSLNSGNFGSAWGLYFFDSGDFLWGINDRCCGQSVRPLRGFAK
ncbi:MAG: hypothetical protein Q4G65_18595 [bacterium]|nr:hypothetical protein [bacterium]